MKNTKLQTQAISFLKEHMIDGGTEKFPDEYKRYEEETDSDGVVIVKAYVGSKGDEGTALIMCRQNWMVVISRRGKMEAYGYPESYDQFKGRKVFHIHVK